MTRHQRLLEKLRPADSTAFATLVDAFAEVALLRREVAQGRNEIEMPALPA